MLNTIRQSSTAASAPIDGWLASPWMREPIQSASNGLPIHTLSARNAIRAARPNRFATRRWYPRAAMSSTGCRGLCTRMITAASEDAYSQLIEPHRAELRAHCYRMLGSVHDAEDALQDALLRAWKGLRRFEGRSSVRTWLYRIATNACVDLMK